MQHRGRHIGQGADAAVEDRLAPDIDQRHGVTGMGGVCLGAQLFGQVTAQLFGVAVIGGDQQFAAGFVCGAPQAAQAPIQDLYSLHRGA